MHLCALTGVHSKHLQLLLHLQALGFVSNSFVGSHASGFQRQKLDVKAVIFFMCVHQCDIMLFVNVAPCVSVSAACAGEL